MKRFIYLIFLVLLSSSVFAKSGHMMLLAVSESGTELIGSTADLYLEVKPGAGKIYIDSFPLTKVDTQISTRFAQEIACDFLDKDCSNLDFFYTIRSSSSIVGGPSAGAAITVLTISVLDNIPLDQSYTITGTINSGGIIGPVGGIPEKLDAALKNNMTKALIPKWSSINESNLTRFENDSMQIILVSTLDDAVYHLLGKKYKRTEELVLSPSYLETMRNIALELCKRTYGLATDLEENNSMQDDAFDLFMKGNASFDLERYYSAASYCFGADVKFNYLRLTKKGMTGREIVEKTTELMNKSREFKGYIQGKKKETITDLQTYLIVSERIDEADEYFREALRKSQGNTTNESIFSLVYGIERLNSAYLWADFFGKEGLKLNINEETLQDSCMQKISEAEERIEYFKAYIPIVPEGIQESLEQAYLDSRRGDNELCLYHASKTKAETDTYLNTFGLLESQLPNVTEERLNIAKKVMANLAEKGIFPIIGYSYYEYAGSLKESDIYSSLLYTEYALELSRMDLYFPRKKASLPAIESRDVMIFLFGGIIGFSLAFSFFGKNNMGKRRKL